MSAVANIAHGSAPPAMHEGKVRLKVLLSAYACHPDQGSEPGVGWNWMRELAVHHDIWLLTESPRFSEPTLRAIQRDEALRRAVTVVPVPRVRAAERWLGSLAYYRTYRLWQRDALRKAQELHAHVRFDLVHQLNMIGYREPGYLGALGLPLVWGPIGGFAQLPWRYLPAMGVQGALSLGLRNTANGLQMRGSRRVHDAMSSAAVLIAATSVDQRAIARLYGRNAVLIHETGSTPDPIAHVRTIRNAEALRVLWCGQMVPRKAVGIALRAVAAAGAVIPIEFFLCGAGPQEAPARALVAQLGIQGRCKFHGQVSHAQAIEAMHDCHVLLFPSLQEATSATVPEALATGLPVLCHAICGQGDVVDEAVGVPVPVGDPDRSIEGFAQGLIALWRQPDRLRACSIAAVERAAQLGWVKKGQVADDLYRTAIATGRSRTGAAIKLQDGA